MTSKAYIVANEEQEREVLEQFETKGYVWLNKGIKPTEWFPSHIEHLIEFPYVLLGDGTVSWEYMYELEDEEIVYDGRKEEKMKISKEVYDALVEWKERRHLQPHVSFDSQYVSWQDLESMAIDIKKWWYQIGINDIEINNRLIAILRWVNGEDVFKVEKPKKWVVRSKSLSNSGNYWYVLAREHDMTDWALNEDGATKFDTKEEAESWANSHQEVVQVEV